MSKYTSIAQLLLAVESVQESLTRGEKMFLTVLANRANFVTGESFPGNEALMRGTMCKTRQGVNHIAKKLIEKNLVEIVANAEGGRGKAAVYKILLEDARFPAAKPASQDLQVLETETRKSEVLNPQVDSGKPASEVAETRKSASVNPQVQTCSQPTSNLIPTSNQPTLQPAGGWWETFAKTFGHAGAEIRPKLEAIGNDLGPLLAKATLKAWKNRPEGLEGLKRPWAVFLKEYRTFIERGRELQYDGMSLAERLAADPELKASIEAQEAEIRKLFSPKPGHMTRDEEIAAGDADLEFLLAQVAEGK